jgi:hypothetical protein
MKESVKKEALDKAKENVLNDYTHLSAERVVSAYEWIIEKDEVHSNDVHFLTYMLKTVAESE